MRMSKWRRTDTVKMIMSVVKLGSGRILADGLDIPEYLVEAMRITSYTPESLIFYESQYFIASQTL